MTVSSTATEWHQVDAPSEPWFRPGALTSVAASESSRTESIRLISQTCRILGFRVESAGLTVREPEITIHDPACARTSEEDVRAQVSALWAEDWDSADDAVYDDW